MWPFDEKEIEKPKSRFAIVKRTVLTRTGKIFEDVNRVDVTYQSSGKGALRKARIDGFNDTTDYVEIIDNRNNAVTLIPGKEVIEIKYEDIDTKNYLKWLEGAKK